MSPAAAAPREHLAVQLDPKALCNELAGKHLIDGKLVAPVEGQTFDVVCPADQQHVCKAALGSKADMDAAVASAAKALPAWREMTPRARGAMVAACGVLLGEHAEELARMVSLEAGKALRTESRGEGAHLADTFAYFAGLAPELKGEQIPYGPGVFAQTEREPWGVVGVIIPFNVPMYLMSLKLAPALVAGNTVVVKSSENAPQCTLRVCQLLNTILPPGVFNMVSGDGPTAGAALAEHPDVAKVSFTGSVATGRTVYEACARKLAPCTLELGGKSPMLVFPDIPLDKAVEGAIKGMRFTRAGQSCSAATRMLVHRSMLDAFVAALKTRLDGMKLGLPLDEETDIGCIVSKRQHAKVLAYIEEARATPGCTVVEASSIPAECQAGCYVRPTLLVGLPTSHRCVREEIFGPVACVLPFESFDEAIAMANDSSYGLCATVWTTNLQTATQAMRKLEAGFCQVNQNIVALPQLPYGGWKQSGLGKECSLGSMLEDYTRCKTIMMATSL